MANLPKGWGKEVAESEETTNRQNIKHGEYIVMHKQPVYKETKAGNAMIIEHRIIESKPTHQGVEPMAPNTDWGYFMPDYGDAKVMLKPNMKAYVIGLLGLDPSKLKDPVSQAKLGDTIDAMCDERFLARGMLLRGVTFETETKSGTYIGMNWYPITGENDPNAESVKKRRAELEANVNAAPPPSTSSNIVSPQNAGPLPPPPGGAPPPPPTGSDPIQAYIAKGWKQHPAAPDYLFIGEGASYQAKSKAEILAGR
jgi:hypothetical protein